MMLGKRKWEVRSKKSIISDLNGRKKKGQEEGKINQKRKKWEKNDKN